MAEWQTRWIQDPVGLTHAGSTPAFRTIQFMEDIIFEARIIETRKDKNKKIVVLDRSLFYPDGKGGQLGDRGNIGDSNIIKVQEKNGLIIHIVDKFPKGEGVKCRINGNRREDISVQHTAQHIISRVILNLFNSETLSFHMGEDISTIDIDNPDLGNEDDIERIEIEANRIVRENRPVKIYEVTKKEIEKLNIRKVVDVEGKIRIVEIEDFDTTMCGGTHVNRTGDIGIIKIVKYEKIKGNILRLYFLAGERALRDYQKRMKILKNLARKFTTREDKVLGSVEKMERELTDFRKEIKLLKEELFEYYLKEEEGKKFVIKGLYLLSMEDMKFLSHEFIERGAKFVYLFNKESGIINKDSSFPLNFKDLLEKLKENFGVRGGGRDFLSIKTDKTLEIGEYLWNMIKSQ